MYKYIVDRLSKC